MTIAEPIPVIAVGTSAIRHVLSIRCFSVDERFGSTKAMRRGLFEKRKQTCEVTYVEGDRKTRERAFTWSRDQSHRDCGLLKSENHVKLISQGMLDRRRLKTRRRTGSNKAEAAVSESIITWL